MSLGESISGTQNDVAHVKWGNGWRMPTLKEFNELKEKCIWCKETLNGHRGYRITGPNGNCIFLPMTGGRPAWLTGSQSKEGNYWSGTLCEYNNERAYILHFDGEVFDSSISEPRYYGFAIRPVAKKSKKK